MFVYFICETVIKIVFCLYGFLVSWFVSVRVPVPAC